MHSESATPSTAPAPADTMAQGGHRPSAKKFALHYAEMVAAMAVGMVVLHPVWMFVLDVLGAAGLMRNPYSGALIMATNMTVAMSAWMRFRGHRWRPIAEMGAAMYVPFLVLFVPLALDLIDTGALMLWGHLLMVPAMAVAMLLRPREYATC
ncbi:hypothetical protein [Streptomyces sp. DSM 118148]|uniref:hypothetical protein n=1 Tax=Streptomyces sp. DSM 118148 TaxID=3448667 RepID=UPI00403FE059